MKRIMLIIISVIMLFSACGNQTDNSVEESIQTQIVPSEEFGGITFGMTDYEVVSILGKNPDFALETYFGYWNEEHFNLSNANVTYYFEENSNMLWRVHYDYYYDESEQERFMNDYEVIKEEILRRYPEEIWTYSNNYENAEHSSLTIYTENRSIFLHASTDYLHISMLIEVFRPGIDNTRIGIAVGEEYRPEDDSQT